MAGMTAEDHLRRMIECVDIRFHYCYFCDSSRHDHEDSCVFVAAENYLKQQDAARKALKQLADDLQDFQPFV